MIDLNIMTAIEAKLDALMNKMGNQDSRMHSAHEVGTVDGNEQKNSVDEGLAHEGPYQVEEAQFLNANRRYNFKPNLNLLTYYTPTLRTMTQPEGVLEDVLIKVGKFIFLMDFVVMDMEEDT